VSQLLTRERHERRERMVNRLHRSTLRAICRQVLEEAYLELTDGYSERFVCGTLGVDARLMEGALRPTVEEVLWERGRLPHPAL
jgi:hypothetical protein